MSCRPTATAPGQAQAQDRDVTQPAIQGAEARLAHRCLTSRCAHDAFGQRGQRESQGPSPACLSQLGHMDKRGPQTEPDELREASVAGPTNSETKSTHIDGLNARILNSKWVVAGSPILGL